jgi:hypothetical protein
MALRPTISDKEALDDGSVRMKVTLTSKTGLFKLSRGGDRLTMRARSVVKARALLEAGLVERREYTEVVENLVPPGRATRGQSELIDVESVEDATSEVLAIFDKEKAIATVLVKNTAD